MFGLILLQKIGVRKPSFVKMENRRGKIECFDIKNGLLRRRRDEMGPVSTM
jgi:hypothetical protein